MVSVQNMKLVLLLIAVLVIESHVSANDITSTSGYSSEVQARIEAFARNELKNAGFTKTEWSAVVLVATKNPSYKLDGYISLKRGVLSAFGTEQVFITGGTDEVGKTRIIVVRPTGTAVQGNIASEVSRLVHEDVFIGSVTEEFAITGTFDAASPQYRIDPRGIGICVGKTCDCSNPCECKDSAGNLSKGICSCKRYIFNWFQCKCPKCGGCESGYYPKNGTKVYCYPSSG